jgi:hypothetical protein
MNKRAPEDKKADEKELSEESAELEKDSRGGGPSPG